MAVPLIKITATTTATITTYAIAATAPVLVVPDFTDSSRTVTQPIAGPSFPSRTFYSAHPVTHAENRTPPPANSGAPACPVPREGKGKRGTQAANGGDHGSGGGSSTTAATADTQFLSYNDPDPVNPLPAFAAPKLDPSSSVGCSAQLTLRVLTSETQW